MVEREGEVGRERGGAREQKRERREREVERDYIDNILQI
jgi:hypothetical protein